MNDPRRLLFVCVENACRSQMAEGFARHYGGDGVEVLSAGSRPASAVNPRAIAFMAERGVDLSDQRPQGIADAATGSFDAVVTMGCGDACPHVPARIRLDWDLEDPKALDDAGFRRVRDEIERRVLLLLDEA
jgi:protein-tyrosine-phosphatase